MEIIRKVIDWLRKPNDYREYNPFETVHIMVRVMCEQEVPRWYGQMY